MNYIEVANTRPVIGYSEVSIPLKTDTFADGKIIHDGLLAFTNVFSHEPNSILIPVGFLTKEYEPDGYLKRNRLKIEFFIDGSFIVTAGEDLKITSLLNITGVAITIGSSYTDYKNEAGNVVFSGSYTTLTSEYYIQKQSSTNLYFVVRATTTYSAYTTNSLLKIGMFYKLV